MNHDENPNDSALAWDLGVALSQLTVPERPPLAAITGRGRAHRRGRLAGFASLGVAAAATALALSLTGAPAAAPARSTGAIHATTPARSTGTREGTIRAAGFILTGDVNGTDTLTLTMSQMLDPATLQQALTEYSIPALVKSGTYCTSDPPPPQPVSGRGE
jgi:hypothetical protein